jgi:antitoxin VapB
MALNIKSKEADRLARELAERTGESITEAVIKALQERLRYIDRPRRMARSEAIRAIQERVARLPVLDHRSDEEILGYNEDGTWD